MSTPLRILSLGAGVQSTTVLLMSLRGDLPPLDAVIFADTGWEPVAVYRHLEWLEGEAARAGLTIHRVTAGNIRDDLASPAASPRGRRSEGERNTSMPFFTRNPNGSVGKLQRQCTKEYKVEPIERFIRRELLGLQPRQRAPLGAVEQWFGISVEEQHRLRVSPAGWKTHRYPLVFDLPKAYARHSCLMWLQEHGYPRPPRSACVGCPFRSAEEWRALEPAEFTDAVEFDAAIRRKVGVTGDLFLHRSAVPLIQVDLSAPEPGGLDLWRDECLGYCGS